MRGRGGYGDPAGRAPGRIASDLEEGYVTEDGVCRDYGIDPDAVKG